jgi:hypothetical protein
VVVVVTHQQFHQLQEQQTPAVAVAVESVTDNPAVQELLL